MGAAVMSWLPREVLLTSRAHAWMLSWLLLCPTCPYSGPCCFAQFHQVLKTAGGGDRQRGKARLTSVLPPAVLSTGDAPSWGPLAAGGCLEDARSLSL